MPKLHEHRKQYAVVLSMWKSTERKLARELRAGHCGRAFHQLRALAIQTGAVETQAKWLAGHEEAATTARRASEASMANTTLQRYIDKVEKSCIKVN